MYQEKEIFLQNLKDKVAKDLDSKFRRGDREHKEGLAKIDVFKEVWEEALDIVTYLKMLEILIEKLKKENNDLKSRIIDLGL